VETERRFHRELAHVPAGWVESARNLVHYVALRQLDLRALQLHLQDEGLSSLGRSESFVLGSLLSVRKRVAEALCVAGAGTEEAVRALARRREGTLGWAEAEALLHAHTRQVLGPRPADRHVYAMVTAPSAAEADRAWMARMLRAGMNVLRINCAHEGPAEWERMAAALAEARRDAACECRVLMDLGGPKVRTGPIHGGARVVTWRVPRDAIGRPADKARVRLVAVGTVVEASELPTLGVAAELLATLRAKDVLRFRDTRGRRRELVLAGKADGARVATSDRRAWVLDRTPFEARRDGKRIGAGRFVVAERADAAIELAVGDALILTGRRVAGRATHTQKRPPRVSCTAPKALARVRPGHRVLLDDGKIEAVVESVTGKDLLLRVRHTLGATAKLRAEKGINLPDSEIDLPSLGQQDLRDLEHVVRLADVVGLSFVRRPEDVRRLHRELARLHAQDRAVVLKIETKAGFESLPRILLEAMRRPPVAVMIARGDLAVEVGFERLAELQDEILWLCEASHVPAIWATQVLDTLARTGVPSRAEVTDAAASVAAECVMLNKGPHIEEAMRVLVDILRRMERHRYKKRSIFRRLAVSALD
jgi:pyruvate kinase